MRESDYKRILNMTILLLVIIISSSNFISALLYAEKINDGSSQVTSDQQLVCFWTLDSTTNANVTWYKSGVQNLTQTDIACTANNPCSTNGEGTGIIPASYTTKTEIWLCSVTYHNGTTYETKNTSVTIINSPPTPPKVYWINGSEIDINNTITNFAEDNTTRFLVNSTDADSDTITYGLDDLTFCSISTSSGNLSCTPTAESHIGQRTLELSARDSASAQYVNFNINVTSTNDAPTVTVSNKVVIEGNALNYNLTGSDAESNSPYNFSVSSDIASIQYVTLNSTSIRLILNHSGTDQANYNDRGNHTVLVSISDSGSPSGTSTTSFNLEVIPNNHLPNISIIVYNNASLVQNGNLSIFINATDIDNDTITFYTNESTLYNISYGTTDHTNSNGTSNAIAWINVTNLTNNHVIQRYVTITVSDGKENRSQSIFLNITNINDAPVIYAISNSAQNSHNNVNMSNLIAYQNILFSYLVNASDPDASTYSADTLTYRNNDSSTFPINTSTGLWSFTPTNIGNFSIKINASDPAGLYDTYNAVLQILPNTVPYFNFTTTPLVIQCYEYDSTNYANDCIYNIGLYASDIDSGDFVDEYAINDSAVLINSSGVINFRANQTDIGNHSINLSITDSRGGLNYTTIYVIINNTNNAPIINNTYIIPSGKIITSDSYEIRVFASDNDLLLSTYENLTFHINVSGANSTMFSLNKISATEATIDFSPMQPTDTGNYTINVSVSDFYNNRSSVLAINFFVYNETFAPNITSITPFGTPFAVDSIDTSSKNYSAFASYNYSTNITIDENTTIVFNQTSFADNLSNYPFSNTLSFEWSLNNSVVSTASSYSKNFNFFSAGTHNMTLTITDEYNKSSTFNWKITVNDFNRAPVRITSPSNLTTNGTTTYANYLSSYNSITRFIDPDDDFNSNNAYDSGENSTLRYNATTCTYATFSFAGSDIRVQTVSVGECFVNFTAIDRLDTSLNVTAYNVLINITGVSNDTTQESTPTPTSSSGGGGSSTQTITVPLPEEVDKPKPLTIITPKLVTVYKNMTIKVPIVLNNTWNDTLEGVSLSASTNATNVSIYLDKKFFPRLYRGVAEEVTLIITNYKSEGHYEIQITGNVTNPTYTDTATIFVNSADAISEGDSIETKIGFARDLLSSNPECQELNELLFQAKNELSNNNFVGSAKLVDDVINGCKYLVSKKSNFTEQPSKSFAKGFEWDSHYGEYIIIALFVVILTASLFYIFKKDDDII